MAKKYLQIAVFTVICCNHLFAQAFRDTMDITWKEGYLDIHHINTGRGNASFCIFPDGTSLLVDAGDIIDSLFIKNSPLTVTRPYPDGSKSSGTRISEYIRQVFKKGQTPVIDYALISHFHGDHYGVITRQSKISRNGVYALSGITEVGDKISIRTLIDRNYPNYDFPIDLTWAYRSEPSSFMNLQRFIKYQKIKNGMVAESLKVGSAGQIVLKYSATSFPDFRVRGIKANGVIWTGKGDSVYRYFTADSVLDDKKKFNENPLSLAIKISYGKFDYFTGGDNTGLQGYGLPKWFDVETPMAKAVGKVEVATLDHHGNRDATNETFLSLLQPKVVVEQTWCSDQPGQEVMHRLVSEHIYKGEKNIFATNIQDATKQTLGFWFTRGYKSMSGHVIIRVLPGGEKYYVMVAETNHDQIKIKRVFGPFLSE